MGRFGAQAGVLIAAFLLPAWAQAGMGGGNRARAAHEGPSDGVNRATGEAGTVIVVEARISPERFDRGFVAGLQADARGNHEAAKQAYARIQRLGRCGPRCAWHLGMTELVLSAREGAKLRPADAGANVSYAIQLHNKLVSLRLDVGHMPSGLVHVVERHYRVALDLSVGTPAARSEVLLGFAAFQGELGATDVAMKLFRQVDLNGLETATQTGNLAYFYTTVGRFDAAMVALERALVLEGPRGRYREWALESDDYHRIKHLPRFAELLELY